MRVDLTTKFNLLLFVSKEKKIRVNWILGMLIDDVFVLVLLQMARDVAFQGSPTSRRAVGIKQGKVNLVCTGVWGDLVTLYFVVV